MSKYLVMAWNEYNIAGSFSETDEYTISLEKGANLRREYKHVVIYEIDGTGNFFQVVHRWTDGEDVSGWLKEITEEIKLLEYE